jgi:hypothetical protein
MSGQKTPANRDLRNLIGDPIERVSIPKVGESCEDGRETYHTPENPGSPVVYDSDQCSPLDQRVAVEPERKGDQFLSEKEC